ncbi:MAG: HAMP domain-containing histidine kinase [Deltaproteobacteria bacterium]|nr:HAMP domain-containing histidine kinase [Deltaproteobacteria bacterium]
MLLLLRWILIVATTYLVLLHGALRDNPIVAGPFLAFYLASNLAVPALLSRARSQKRLVMGIALFDAVSVSIALSLARGVPSDFFLLYFVVIFIATLSDRTAMVAATAAVIGLLHLYSTARGLGAAAALSSATLLQVPFLFVVALFFGHLVERARAAEQEAEEAHRREQLLTGFISGVVRDLKNPLGMIQAMAEIVLEPRSGRLTAEQAELVRRVHASARHVLRVALNVLDARHVEAGRLSLERQPVSLIDVVLEAMTVVRCASELKGISLDIETVPGLPDVHIDPMEMDRVVWNLLDNAIRCAPAGGEVVVSLDRTSRQVILAVSDDGPGVSPKDLPMLFEKYRRTGSGEFASSGLGLFVAKAIVEAHGGTIEVDSLAGVGTTVTVRLPSPPRPEVDPTVGARESTAAALPA